MISSAFIFLFIIFQLENSITINDIQVYGGNYGNLFKFIISGIAQENISSSDNVIMKLIINEKKENSKCSIKETGIGQLAIFSCFFNQNINQNNIYLANDANNEIQLIENLEIKPLELKLTNIYAYNLEYFESNWQFNLEGELVQNQNFPLDSVTYMDINLNNENKVAGCILKYHILSSIRLICKVNSLEQDLTNEIIIPKEKSDISSVIFEPELQNDITIIKKSSSDNIFNLQFLGAFYRKYNSSHYSLRILLSEQIISERKILLVKLSKNRYFKDLDYIPCTIKDEFLYCLEETKTPLYYGIDLSSSNDNNNDEIFWTNIDTNYAIITSYYYNIYLDINDFSYNSENNCYEILFNTKNYYEDNFFIIVDILINSDPSYLYCYYNTDSKLFHCKSKKVINYNKDDKVQFSNMELYGIKNITTINANLNPVFIQNLYVYDLHLENNIWAFIIECKDDLEDNGVMTLEVSIDYYKSGWAYCNKNDINNKLLMCKVNSAKKNETIRLKINGKGQIKLYNIEEIYIPLNINFEFIFAANFDKREDYFAFDIYVNYDISIPLGSHFWVDYIYDNTNIIAECYFRDSPPNHIFCYSYHNCENETLIKLTNNKSKYSSVTWKNIIPENIEFYLKTDILYLSSVESPDFNPNTNKWSFIINDIYTSSCFQKIRKIQIDLIYNGENTTALCDYSCDTNKLEKYTCTPNIDNQKETDLFEINKKKIKSSVIYNNHDINALKVLFHANFKYEFAYDYRTIYRDYSYIQFRIRVSESNLLEGRSTKIDLKSDGGYGQAICTMENNNILLCEYFKGDYGYEDSMSFDNLSLVNDLENKYINWINLIDKEEKYIFQTLYINYTEVDGIFINNTWKFKIWYNSTVNFRSYEFVDTLIDIYINNRSATAFCKPSFYYLECECKHSNQRRNDIIKLRGEKNPYLGTIHFVKELSEDQKLIKPNNYSIYNVSMVYSKLYPNNTLYFLLSYKRQRGLKYYYTLSEVEIIVYRENGENIISKAICENGYFQLTCYSEQAIKRCEETKLYVNSSGYSGFIEIITENRTNIFIDTSNNYGNCPPPKHVDIIQIDNSTNLTDSVDSTDHINNIAVDSSKTIVEKNSSGVFLYIMLKKIILLILFVLFN